MRDVRPLAADLLAAAVLAAAATQIVGASPVRAGLAATALAVVAGAWRPTRRVVHGLAAAAAVLALADLGLRRTAPGGLVDRALRVRAELVWRTADGPAAVRGTCPKHRFPAGDLTDGPPARDARGFLVLEGPGPTVLVVGDSVLHRGFARQLHEALAAGGVPARVVDTSRPSYDLDDETCAAAEALAEPVDLVVVGHVVNDLRFPPTVDVDLGDGPARYALDSILPPPDRLVEAPFPPLVLAADDPWVAANAAALRARFGDRLALDVADPAALAATGIPPGRANTWLAGDLDRFLAVVAQRPTVHLVVPMVHPRPTPFDPHLDGLLELLADRGRVAVDLRRAWAGLGMPEIGRAADADLARVGTDPLHPAPAGLWLAVDAALAAWARQGTAPELTAARRHALDRAAAELGDGPWRCEPAPDGPTCARSAE